MTIRSRTGLIMGIIRPERPELFALELGKIAEFDFVYTLASTKVNQSVPNWVKMNMTTRSQMSWIMEVIRPELSKLSALELENLPYLTLFSAKINQSAPNLDTIYMTIRSRMSLIVDIIRPEHQELFALELGKIVESDFDYTVVSTNINQSVQTQSRLCCIELNDI